MHLKDIKAQVRKQLKSKFPNWHRFNLLKKREGLEYTRVRGQHNILAQSIFATAATLLIEMSGTRKSIKPNRQQMELFAAA